MAGSPEVVKSRCRQKWQFKTKEQLDQENPSLRDGLDYISLTAWHKAVFNFIKEAAMALSILCVPMPVTLTALHHAHSPPFQIATAAMLCHRFFSKRSMLRNDKFLIATACLFLGCKMGDATKSLKQISSVFEDIKWKNDSVKRQELVQDEVYMKDLQQQILFAERVVMFTLGFDFSVALDHPFKYLLQVFVKFRLNAEEPEDTLLMNRAWSLLLESFRTTLCLQFDSPVLAYAIFGLVARLLQHRVVQSELDFLEACQSPMEGQSLQDVPTFSLQDLRAIWDQVEAFVVSFPDAPHYETQMRMEAIQVARDPRTPLTPGGPM